MQGIFTDQEIDAYIAHAAAILNGNKPHRLSEINAILRDFRTETTKARSISDKLDGPCYYCHKAPCGCEPGFGARTEAYSHHPTLFAVPISSKDEGWTPMPADWLMKMSPCCDATVYASLCDGVLVGFCAACGQTVSRKNPTTGVLELRSDLVKNP